MGITVIKFGVKGKRWIGGAKRKTDTHRWIVRGRYQRPKGVFPAINTQPTLTVKVLLAINTQPTLPDSDCESSACDKHPADSDCERKERKRMAV